MPTSGASPGRAEAGPGLDVALVCMPFAQYRQPSLGLSLLKSGLTGRGLSCRVFYPNLELAERIGAATYELISTWYPTDLLGDWLFSKALFGESRDDEGYLDSVLRGKDPRHNQAYFGKRPLEARTVEELLAIREDIPAFLQACAERILAPVPRIVGFTSQFHQHTASLALAQVLKAHRPDLFIVGGGVNFRGAMGQEAVSRFDCLDAVVSGEGDLVFPTLAERVLQGGAWDDLPGVLTRGTPVLQDAPALRCMDETPRPDLEDFQEAWRASSFSETQAPRYLMETSRGCWWGARSRCLFCGQASAGLEFRSKTAERVADELGDLHRTHPDAMIIITDEIINPRFFQTLLPEIIQRHLGARIVYFEVRPDLTREQLRMLQLAGTQRVEVGIESLSSSVLGLVRKGVTALQCLQFLKWCRELGIAVVWNWLWGFPGEPVAEYARLARLVSSIPHLPPPNYVGPFRLDRFSPYFVHTEAHGLTSVDAYPAYRWVYPFPPETLKQLAYYFTYQLADAGQRVESYTQPLAAGIDRWKESHACAALISVDEGHRMVLVDRRDPSREPQFTALDGIHRTLYAACGQIRTFFELTQIARRENPLQGSGTDLRNALDSLVESGWMACDGDAYLALAIPDTAFKGHGHTSDIHSVSNRV